MLSLPWLPTRGVCVTQICYGFCGPSLIMPLDAISACPMQISGFFLNSSGVLNLPPKQRQQTHKSQLSKCCAGVSMLNIANGVDEATTEQLYGCTFALTSFKCYRETLPPP